ncbi:hypothetical protein HG530_014515 [Fusarium avenaceum]|nr:hypothetical protein DER45DRAFT_599935 [Fusarium avenaceum]KAI6750619.1 hypothetical protein HG530_014515 [Fusarium avenaceum]
MVAKTLVAAVFAAYVAAGPCKPQSLPSDIFSVTESTVATTPAQITTSGHSTTQSEAGSTSESILIDSLTTTSFEQSTQTTEAASTTTSSGPIGEAIILQVNPQRRLAKRDTTFVGNNNPTSCDLATVFHFDSEQLLQDGVPVYYEGEGYQELTAQGTVPAGAVTRAFSITEGYLSWTNAAFGQAGFCQTPSDGKVYITFTSKPTGCQSVTLGSYKQSQCQNGQIVVDQESSSTEATKTTQEVTSSETTSQSTEVTSSANVCLAGLNDPNGQPDVESRISDCSAYNTVTVSPLASTSTVLKRRVYYQIPTAWATPQPKITKRADDPTDTTIFPTEVPSYATYCDSPSEYYEACSEAGVTAFTTTLPEPDATTTTSTSNGCGPLSKMKRGIEYLGYTLSEDWDRAIFTGVVLHERFHD